jgi:Bacterial SH3 domain
VTLPRHGSAVACVAVALAALVACSGGGAGAPPTARATGRSASPTAQVAGTVRTVLTPLGLNIRSQPSRSAQVAGTAAWGTLLTVLDHRGSGGSGWYQVQGQSVTGWISDDPSLSAQGQVNPYQSARGFSSLYPVDWTFAEEAADTLFRPQQGSPASIVVRTAATVSAFGNQPAGYAIAYSDDSLVVCGYTGTLIESALVQGASPPPQPSGSTAVSLSKHADIRLRFDAAHAMELAFNYDSQDQLPIFEDFYNAITYPYPLCQAPESPAPQPT